MPTISVERLLDHVYYDHHICHYIILLLLFISSEASSVWSTVFAVISSTVDILFLRLNCLLVYSSETELVNRFGDRVSSS